ncbi:MAG TPA: hypothetical protein VGI99_11260 [Gemmataceae bacterium]|jgi:uncharacterized protein YegP (UPF0339 family)
MHKILTAASLALAIGFISSASPERVSGQAKKPAPAAVKAGTVEIYKAKDGFRYRIKNPEGKVIAMPPKGYADKAECQKVLDIVKATLNSAKPTESKD